MNTEILHLLNLMEDNECCPAVFMSYAELLVVAADKSVLDNQK